MNILIIEQERYLREALTHTLKAAGHICYATAKLEDAMLAIARETYDLLIIDNFLYSGLKKGVIDRFKERNSNRKIVSFQNSQPQGFEKTENDGILFLDKSSFRSRLLQIIDQLIGQITNSVKIWKE